MLARALAQPSNLLVLDEPTNDLDIETLDLLQELLGDYAGTILLVSHDRDFLDRVATSVVVSEGGGRWTEYAGGYSDMVAQRGFGLVAPERAGDGQSAERASARGAVAGDGQTSIVVQGQARARAAAGAHRRFAGGAGEARYAARRSAAPRARSQSPSSARRATMAIRHAELERAEEEWLTLEMLREEIEG